MGRKVLIMGLGNILLRDEGLGVRAVERLTARYALPPEATAIDGGTLGLGLMPYLEGVSDLLLLDAVRSGAAPGAIVRLEGEDIPIALAQKMSMHQLGLQELLAVGALQGALPPRLVLWGMEPDALEPGLDLSPAVAAGLDALVAAAAGELRSWGLELV